jgi:hypothetical protein
MTARRSKSPRVLKTFKGTPEPYQKLVGVPPFTVKMTDEAAFQYIDSPIPRGPNIPPAKADPRPPIRYPATWWDAVKARWVPKWAYGWGIKEPTFVVHQL